jgi:lysophospholipase L1-like esterase
LALAGCTGGGTAGPTDREGPGGAIAAAPPSIDYVALGDSYSAGPLISTVRSDPSECGRSTNNYPAFLADWLDVGSYRDVTCSGAETADLTRPQGLYGVRRVPPQLDALSRRTDLVTIGLGGNDFGIFGTLSDCVEGSCAIDPAALTRSAGRVEGRLVRVLEQVAARAPRAEVYVVGYPRVLPQRRTCPAAGLPAGQAGAAAGVQERLNASLAGAADTVGATYVDLWAASRGRDVCAGDGAWVNGRRVRPGVAAPFHPVLAGMRGAATEVYRAVTGEEPPSAGPYAEPDLEAVVRNVVRR